MKNRNRMNRRFLVSCLTGLVIAGSTLGSSVTAFAMPASGEVNTSANVRDDIGGNIVYGVQSGQKMAITDEKQSDDGYTWYAVTFAVNGVKMQGWIRGDLMETSDVALTDEELYGTTDAAGDTSTEDTSAEETAVVDGSFTNGSHGYEIADTFPDEIPDGFSAITLTVRSVEYSAAKMDNADVYLLNMTDNETGEDALMVYDSERDAVTPYAPIGEEGSQVLLVDIPVDMAEAVSTSYTQTSCPVSDGEIIGYQLSDAGDYIMSDVSASDFYYAYGIGEDGNGGWYSYDAANDTLQRSAISMSYQQTAPVTTAVEDTEEAEEAGDESASGLSSLLDFKNWGMDEILMAGAAVICLILLIMVIVISTRYRRLCDEIDSQYDEEEEAKEEKKKNRKKEKKAEDLWLMDEEKEPAPVKKAEPKAEKKKTEKKEKPQIVEEVKKETKPEPKQVKKAVVKTEKVAAPVAEKPIFDDILDLDADDGYDVKSENTPEDDKEFNRFEEEPDYFDDEEELDLEKILLNAVEDEPAVAAQKADDVVPETDQLDLTDDLAILDELNRAMDGKEKKTKKKDKDDFDWDDLEFL